MQKEIDNYLKAFEAAQKGWKLSDPSWLNRYRRNAIESFAKTGFPAVGDEEWKYTNVAPLAAIPFGINGTGFKKLSPQDISTLIPGAYANSLLVFINGHYSTSLSHPGQIPEGIKISPLSQVLVENPSLLEPHLARLTDGDKNPFSCLNTALMRDGAFVSLPMGMRVKTPIYLVFLSTFSGKAQVTHPRNLIVAGEKFEAVLVEYYLGTGMTDEAGAYFTNAVTEVVSGDCSVIEHIKIQDEAAHAFHIASLKVHQARSSRFVSNYISLGGALSRNNIHDRLDAVGCDCTLNGLTLGLGTQHMDSHTRIDHFKPNGTSNELYKGIFDDRSRGIFDGKIVVHKDAQKTSAHQTNKNLLLSDQAEVDPTPQLEILADDVKASHGVAVGQLDKNQIFYLRSRGIGEAAAKSLLIYAFASELIDKIKISAIKSRLQEALVGRFKLL